MTNRLDQHRSILVILYLSYVGDGWILSICLYLPYLVIMGIDSAMLLSLREYEPIPCLEGHLWDYQWPLPIISMEFESTC